MKSNVDKGGIAITSITLILFAISLGALFRGNNSTKTSSVGSDISFQPSFQPVDSVTESISINNPVLEEKIAKVSVQIVAKVIIGSSNNTVKFIAAISNLSDLEVNQREFIATNKATGQEYKGVPTDLVDSISFGNTTVLAKELGANKLCSFTFPKIGDSDTAYPALPYGQYEVTFSFGYLDSQTKTTTSKIFNYTEAGIR